MRVLICGASGFIGRNLAARLGARPELEVFGTHHTRPDPGIPGVTPIQADLCDAAQVDQAVQGMDVIIQAAATTSGAGDIVNRPHIHVADNAVMNSLIFRAAHDHSVSRVVFFSCTIMYQSSDEAIKESDLDESQPMSPNYFGAGWTKLYLEKMSRFYAGLGRTRYTVLRHSNIYGPFDKFDLEHSHVFGATLTKVLTTRDDRLVIWGPGSEARDLLYIDDLVDFVEAALERQDAPFELVNVGSGRAVTVLELAQRIIAASGRELVIEHDLERPNLPVNIRLDISRAKERFGWEPRVSLDDGIGCTMDWYRQNLLAGAG